MKDSVFVVEDDPSIRQLLAFILESEDFEVCWESNGKSADNYISCHAPPKIVVLDISLPEMDGYGLLQRIRSHKRWKYTPVLMLTALSQAKDVNKAVESGANDYLLKPFHPEELIKRVRKLCLQEDGEDGTRYILQAADALASASLRFPSKATQVAFSTPEMKTPACAGVCNNWRSGRDSNPRPPA